MRGLVMVAVVVGLTAGLGLAICTALGTEAHIRSMVMAAVACLTAGEAAMIPLLLTRSSSQVAAVQGSLVGTVLHLFVAIGLGATVFMVIRPDAAFLYWLLAFYWATLIVVVVSCIQAVKAAPTGGAATKR